MLRPAVLLRLESLLVLLVSAALFRHFQGRWMLFGLLFFVPDISILVYTESAYWGWRAYNLAHTYVSPLLLIGTTLLTHRDRIAMWGLIWCAHIGLDRMLAFGLKLDEDFWNTHLSSLEGERRLWQRFVAHLQTPRTSPRGSR